MQDLPKILAAIILASWTRSWASLGQVLDKSCPSSCPRSWASLAQELFAERCWCSDSRPTDGALIVGILLVL